jgi:PAS domain S-box-containing protein
MRVWRNASLGWKLTVFAGAVAACVAVQGIVSRENMRDVRVPGEVYHMLRDTEVLIADVLPPPKYIIETHLLAHELQHVSRSELPTYEARFARLERDFLERSQHWKDYSGLDAALSEQLNKTSDDLAREYFRIVRETLLPLAVNGKSQAMNDLVEDVLTPLYRSHRASIDEVVRLATVRRAEREAYAEQMNRRTDASMLVTTLGIALGGMALSLLLSRSIARPMRATAEAMRLYAAKRTLPTQLDLDRTDELGDVARALHQLTFELEESERQAMAATDAMKVTNEQLALALEATGLCLWRWYPQDDAIEIDERVLKWAGIETRPATGAEWHTNIHPDDLAVMHARMASLLDGTSEVFSAEYRVRTSNGRWIWLLARGKVQHKDGSGNLVSVQGTHLDITSERQHSEELRLAKEAAEAANKAKSDFLANMSHELRTPLAAILGSADLLYNDGDIAQAPVRRIENIDAIARSGKHLLTIINDVLDLSKVESGKLTVQEEPVDLCEVLREVVSFVRPRATPKGVALGVTFDTPMPSVAQTDKTRLRQVLLNIMGNAVKFTDKGEVHVHCRLQTVPGQSPDSSQPVLVFDVTDTGIGLTSEQQARLFRAFEQADGTMSRQFGGTGLGLVISRKLAQLMGGDVRILRSEPGAGSTFRVTVAPTCVSGAIERFEEGMHIQASMIAKSQTKIEGRVLLAEDGADNQRLISHFVRKAGATVDVAENGRVAMELIDKADQAGKPYELILMDMQMPECDGYTAARTLRAVGNNTPIIALTAHAMPEDRAKCLAAGCNDYTTKPVDRATLIAICATWLERTRAGTKNAA